MPSCGPLGQRMLICIAEQKAYGRIIIIIIIIIIIGLHENKASAAAAAELIITRKGSFW